MSVQDLYFATMARACAAMAGSSDPVLAGAFAWLGRTMALVGLRAHANDGVTIDRLGSGLPILKEAAAPGIDLAEELTSHDDPEALRRQMLDFMMTRRRRPPADLSRRMALAVYSEALRCPEPWFGCEPGPTGLGAFGGRTDRAEGAWDHWDGVASMPAAVRCAFAGGEGVDGNAADAVLREVARLFSAQAFSALALAREVDERFRRLRLHSLSRLSIGPFRSDVFTEGSDALARLLAQVGDVGQSWVLCWTNEEVRSEGTAQRRCGFLGMFSRPYEKLRADPPDLAMLVPHAAYQLMADDSEGRAILSSRRVHVLGRVDIPASFSR